ncbi:uncharacterized protein LOC131652643 [Vicia villosa]|uniref:uncharacterized protein LOC131652643 n=1 Tax=Vicia villosa TaxID=3911 RepID=UPI00273B0590|nr:uncharacterized protein LOC131652643 [Vicia villosa]
MGRIVTRSQSLKLLNKCSTHNDDSDSNSNRSKRCKVISNVLLPQDLMLHILNFVSLKCLVNSARYVCKPWATTIRTSQFAQACLTNSKPGLYVENCGSESRSYFLDIKNCVNGQFEFERTDLGTPSKMGRIVTSCNGILLLLHRSLMEAQTFLVNPIIKCWLRIPPLPMSRKRFQLGVQFALVCVPHTAKFKLFYIDILEVSGVFLYVFYVLTIGIDSSWKEIDRKEAPRDWHNLWKPLYDGGNYLYWISAQYGITVVDVDKEITVRKFSLPPVSMDPHPIAEFLWMGNLLSCIVCEYEDDHYKTFQIYILDFDSEKWSLYHEMGPFDYVAVCGQELNITVLAFRYWICDQIIFRVAILPMREENLPAGRCTMHFSYNVKTRKVTKIESIAMADHEVWLHTNSLISLPSTPT